MNAIQDGPKVTLLSPCYNVDKYIKTFLDSVLEQNYPSLEIILVDDGSIDSTPNIIEEYREAFEKRGVEYRYVRKENGGQASAIAFGLPLVTGKYLIWPDPDDFLLKDSIIKRVEYMESHLECGIVRSNGLVFDETNLQKDIGRVSKKWSRHADIEDYVRFSVPWCSGCYMIRMSALHKVNPGRKIYDSRCGQNIQMLLPIVSEFPCHYLDENLYGYVHRQNSHSRQNKDYSSSSAHIDDMQDCVIQTLAILNKDMSRYVDMHASFNRKVHYQTAWRFGEVEEMYKFEQELREHGEYSLYYRMLKYVKPGSKGANILRYYDAIQRRISSLLKKCCQAKD